MVRLVLSSTSSVGDERVDSCPIKIGIRCCNTTDIVDPEVSLVIVSTWYSVRV